MNNVTRIKPAIGDKYKFGTITWKVVEVSFTEVILKNEREEVCELPMKTFAGYLFTEEMHPVCDELPELAAVIHMDKKRVA
jgi:hypothetical protein